jgi:hypothetical protein
MIELVHIPQKVPYSKFTPEVLFELPEVPLDVAENYVRETVIRLAEDSLLMHREVKIRTQLGCDSYLLEPPDDTRTLKIIRVCDWQGRELAIKNGICMSPCNIGAWDWCGGKSCNGSVPWATFRHPNELIVVPPPAGEFELGFSVVLAVAPDRDSCEVDEIVYQRYAQVVIDGAVAALLRMPNKTWSSQAAAAKRAQDFNHGKMRAHLDQMVGSAGAHQRLVTRRFV